MIRLGERQTLTVVKKVDFGVYLADTTEPGSVRTDEKQTGGKQTGATEPGSMDISKAAPENTGFGGIYSEEVLLPQNEVPRDIEVHDPIGVFVYRDSSDRPIATVTDPYIHLGEVRRLKVKEVGKIGAFLDWGLPKDLLLPFGEQKGRPGAGESVDVRLYIDKSGRLCASMWVSKEQKKEGAYESGARTLLELLKDAGGLLSLTDASSPEEIRAKTGMSKKEFKRSVGNLYKKRAIRLEKDGIRLTTTIS